MSKELLQLGGGALAVLAESSASRAEKVLEWSGSLLDDMFICHDHN